MIRAYFHPQLGEPDGGKCANDAHMDVRRLILTAKMYLVYRVTVDDVIKMLIAIAAVYG